MSLYSELSRRKVIRVSIGYLAAAWLLVQIAETLLPVYGFTDAAIRILVAILAIGLIPVSILAWLFDWSSGGIHKTAAMEGEVGTRTRLWQNALLLVLLVGATALASYFAIRGIDDATMTDHTIAILPFNKLSSDVADTFTDGMHVGVITRLSSVQDLDVISRTSVLKYREVTESLRDIATELGAAWILRGDVQQDGDNVLVSAQLADARKDRQVWAAEYRRTLTASNVFDIQADISRQIIDALQATLTASEVSRIESVPTEDLEAYRLFQQGRSLLDRRTEDSMRQSVSYFERALEADAGYAPAWVGLADSVLLLHTYRLDNDPASIGRVERALERALQLDRDLAEAYATRALLAYANRDGVAAIRDIDHAVGLSPSFAEAYTWRNFLYAMFGDPEEGLNSVRRAVVLDPLNAEAVANLSGALMSMGRFDQALVEARRIRELSPEWSNGRLIEGQALHHLGHFEQAIDVLDGVSVPWTGAGAETALARAYVAAGQRDAALEVLAGIEKIGDEFSAAVVRAALGSVDEAYDYLLARQDWDGWQTLSTRYHYRDILDPDNDDPRYRDLIRKINASWGIPPEGLAEASAL